MSGYLSMVMILCFFVDVFLLLGTNQMSGFPQNYMQTILAAALGAVYSGLCMVSAYMFLGKGIFRLLSLLGMGLVCFGISRSALRRILLFMLLHMAMGGLQQWIGNGGLLSVFIAAVAVVALCVLGIRGRLGASHLVPVSLGNGKEQIEILALRDTGNTLTDPLTGQNVLVVGPEIAHLLLGFTQAQLQDPITTMATAQIPGLRLIPYHTVGQPVGMLLAVRMPMVQIGKWRGAHVIAFAPSVLDQEGTYQALTGGCV